MKPKKSARTPNIGEGEPGPESPGRPIDYETSDKLRLKTIKADFKKGVPTNVPTI